MKFCVPALQPVQVPYMTAQPFFFFSNISCFVIEIELFFSFFDIMVTKATPRSGERDEK